MVKFDWKRLFLAFLVLQVLMWGSYLVYDITGKSFVCVAQNCERADWGLAFLFGVQAPLLVLFMILTITASKID